MTAKELKINYLEAKKAKTKFQMCYWMDKFNWKNIPWVSIICDAYTKDDLKAEYAVFLSSFGF